VRDRAFDQGGAVTGSEPRIPLTVSIKNDTQTQGRAKAVKKKKGPHIGSAFETFLEVESIRDEVEAVAINRILARKVAEAMKTEGLTKAAMARRMQTSRMALDRLLDPANASVTLQTMLKAAAAVGRQLRVELV